MDYLVAIYTGSKIHTRKIEQGSTVTVGNSRSDTIIIDKYALGPEYLVMACDPGGVHILSKQPMKFGNEETTNRVLSAGETISVTEKITLAVYPARCPVSFSLSLDRFSELHLGRSYNSNDIALQDSGVSSRHAVLKKHEGRWFITDLKSHNGTFVGGNIAMPHEEVPAEEATIFISGYTFYIQGDMIHFQNIPGGIDFAPAQINALVYTSEKQKPYPFFQRSPRIRGSADKAEFELASPPAVSQKPTVSWFMLLLQPVMMVAIMGFIAVMMKNYSMLMYSVPMSFMSIIMTILNNKNNMKKWQKNNGTAVEKYSEYLEQTESEIISSEGAYISALSGASPGSLECLSIAESVSRRLWERTVRDSDFLSVRLGIGSVPSNVHIKVPMSQMSVEDNPFIAQAEAIRDRHTTLAGVPVCHSLKDYPITGLAGRRDDVIRAAWRIIMDIATHHAYTDVKFICVYPKEEREKWEWMRWLPHIWDSKQKKRYLACDKDEARIMLREAAGMLRTRSKEAGERMDKDAPPPTPFYVLILADRMLTEASGEQFFPASSAVGFAALYVYGDIGSLPGECQSVITCGPEGRIQTTEPGKGTTTTSFTADNVSLSIMDAFARALAPVKLMQSGGGSRMPTSITFMQGFKANTVADLDIIGRWGKNHSESSLAAEIGIQENGDVFKFDVFEKAMGPHGIAAGTSGSGKSEMLTTWLLSLALNFSPKDVNIALIEFKGNDLSNILHDLPHIAGIVSNLNDPSTIIRGLKSLKGEKDRRMRLFEQSDFLSSKSIFAYQKYQKSHPEAGLEPLPYLIIVIDEFAELVTQYPEFNDEIVSIARVGRSVGMYMTLTMQSPQGVVKGQVSSNTKFRVCLRTANAGESKEILGTADAFNISAPGRAYIKVGNGEVYEQVQTFYAKAPYRPGGGQKTGIGEIRLVALDGTKTKPEIYSKTVKKGKDEQSEGNVIVREIISTAEAQHMGRARPVWTDPLPLMLPLDGLIKGHEAFDREAKTWHDANKGLAVTVGLVDAPEEQRQYPFVLDFMKNGHQVLYGAPSTGKTSFLQTVLTSAAMCYTPDQVNFVIIDYGSFILKAFEPLPHTIIAADPTDEDKVKKTAEFMRRELATRRKLFSAEGVASLESYREAIGKPVPAIIVIVDNIASVSGQSSELMDVLNLTARDGGGLGVYLMITTGSGGGFMYKITQYVKSNHTLQLTERTEYRPLIGGEGRSEPGKYPGRGFTKGALEYQTALCVEGETETERSRKLKALCADMSAAWTGKRASLAEAEAARTAPVGAEELSFSTDGVQIGMTKDTREPVEFVYEAMHGCIISGTFGGGKSSILAMIAKALNDDPKTRLYVYEEDTFIEKFCPNAKVIHKPEEMDEIIAGLDAEYSERSEDSEDRIVICLDNFYNLYQDITQESADILEAIARGGPERKMFIYAVCTSKALSTLGMSDVPLYSELMKYGNAVVTGGTLKEYREFNAFHREDDISFGSHEGALIHGGRVVNLMFGMP
ncbi:MAG: type VII secretion protein EssC [Synergistaceae bacterium]|nr:type VII secretion protein EssC [Synergistaceae bacterium]